MRPPLGFTSWLDVYPSLTLEDSEVVVDKSQLISIIEYWDTSSGEYPPENYTPESYQAVLDAYAIAVAVRDNGEATQEEVDTAYLDLLNAISGLEEVPIEPEDCSYPFDVAPVELAAIGYNPYPVHDECYNKFSWDGSGIGNYAATKKEAFEFFATGTVPDSVKIPLPESTGTAIEYRIKFPSDVDKSAYPILNALVFDITSGGAHSGGGIYLQQNTAMNRNLFVLGQGEASGSPISVPQEISEITVSVLYKSDGTMDVKTVYGEVLGKTYLLDSFLALTSEGNTDGEFEVITKAKDLTFTYPEGTKGLDGELVN